MKKKMNQQVSILCYPTLTVFNNKPTYFCVYMQLSMPKTSNNIGKIIRLTWHRAGIQNIRSTFPCSKRLLIFMAAGFRSTCCFVFFPWHNTMKQSLCEYTIGFICESELSFTLVPQLQRRRCKPYNMATFLSRGRPLFERLMFVNGEGKLSNIHIVHTIYSQKTSKRHLQQPVSADCNDTVRCSNTIGKYVLSVLQKMAPAQCSPAMHFG